MHILLLEKNDLDSTESLIPFLEAQGHHVFVAHTSEAVVNQGKTIWPNLVIFNPVNSHLKLTNFEEIINEIDLKIPYLIVGEKSHLPFNADVDIAAVDSNDPQQLNQTIQKAASIQEDRFIRLPDLILDCHQNRVLRDQKQYALTPKESKLLHLLIDHHDQVLSRKVIMHEVWETDYMGDTRTLDVHIRWLREKIEENPSHPRHLITIRGVGYSFITESE